MRWDDCMEWSVVTDETGRDRTISEPYELDRVHINSCLLWLMAKVYLHVSPVLRYPYRMQIFQMQGIRGFVTDILFHLLMSLVPLVHLGPKPPLDL